MQIAKHLLKRSFVEKLGRWHLVLPNKPQQSQHSSDVFFRDTLATRFIATEACANTKRFPDLFNEEPSSSNLLLFRCVMRQVCVKWPTRAESGNSLDTGRVKGTIVHFVLLPNVTPHSWQLMLPNISASLKLIFHHSHDFCTKYVIYFDQLLPQKHVMCW